MPETPQQLLLGVDNPAIRPLPRRRGRPPGSKNLRSLDLAKYIEAAYGGLTPGQQSAAIAMVTPGEARRAAADARALGIVDPGLAPLLLALVVKARRLAIALGCEAFEAWAMLATERRDLMRYVHQVQPAAKEQSNRAPATVFLVPEGEARDAAIGQLPDDSQDPDFIDVLEADGETVLRSPSYVDDESQ